MWAKFYITKLTHPEEQPHLLTLKLNNMYLSLNEAKWPIFRYLLSMSSSIISYKTCLNIDTDTQTISTDNDLFHTRSLPMIKYVHIWFMCKQFKMIVCASVHFYARESSLSYDMWYFRKPKLFAFNPSRSVVIHVAPTSYYI